MKNITEKLEKIVNKNNIYLNEPMSRHTSFKIGGKADCYVKIESEQELKMVLDLVKSENIPYFIIGNGTNLLVREKGIRGVVIKVDLKEHTIGKQDEFAYVTVGCRNDTGPIIVNCIRK